MPPYSAYFESSPSDGTGKKVVCLPSDEEFDQVYPAPIREVSAHHWSKVEACHQAAKWLVTRPGTRVLDIGCGPGKFCAIGAMSTSGHFTGVEVRSHLCHTALRMLEHYRIKRVQILNANVTEMEFNCFDAFYLFNPFEENLLPIFKIDDKVPVHMDLYYRYINYVRRELCRMRLGTRVVTFWGACEEIPTCYECMDTAFDRELQLWVKRREGDFSAIDCNAIQVPKTQEFAIH